MTSLSLRSAETREPARGSGKGLGVLVAIAPGLYVSAASLFTATARLPRVEIAEPRSIIGKNTVESIQSGLMFGTAAEVEGD